MLRYARRSIVRHRDEMVWIQVDSAGNHVTRWGERLLRQAAADLPVKIEITGHGRHDLATRSQALSGYLSTTLVDRVAQVLDQLQAEGPGRTGHAGLLRARDAVGPAQLRRRVPGSCEPPGRDPPGRRTGLVQRALEDAPGGGRRGAVPVHATVSGRGRDDPCARRDLGLQEEPRHGRDRPDRQVPRRGGRFLRTGRHPDRRAVRGPGSSTGRPAGSPSCSPR